MLSLIYGPNISILIETEGQPGQHQVIENKRENAPTTRGGGAPQTRNTAT